MILVVPIAAALLSFAAPAIQPASDPSGMAATPTGPQALLTRSRAAYRDGPIAERITIAVTSDSVTQFDEYIIRLRASATTRDLRLELPALTIWASTEGANGVLAARHAQNRNVVMRTPLESPLSATTLRRHLPSIIAPQIDLAFGGTTNLDSPDWSLSGPSEISAQLPPGRVTLRFDPTTGRLLGYQLQSSELSIRLRMTPVEPGDPAAWAIDTADKRFVSAISELRASPRTIPLGEKFPFKILQDAHMNSWPIELALANRSDPPRRPEERYLVLVFHRVPDEDAPRGPILDRVATAIDAGSQVEQTLSRSSRRPEGLGPRRSLVRVIVRPVACLTIPQARRENIARLAARWPLDTGGSGLLWTVSPEQTIDRLAPASDAVVVIIDDQTRLLSIVPIETDIDGDALASTIEETIMREVNLLADP